MRSILVLALSLLSSATAIADETTTSTKTSILAAGRAEIREGSYETGIAKLVEAHAMARSPEILFEIAVAYSEWQGHCQDSITAFDRFFGACQQCSSFSAAKERSARVRSACMVKVKVETVPPGAMISIDGEAIGSSPLEATVVAGKHAFAAELTGYDNPSASHSLPPGLHDTVVKLTLVPLPAFSNAALSPGSHNRRGGRRCAEGCSSAVASAPKRAGLDRSRRDGKE